MLFHAKGSQKGEWKQGRWWFDFFTIYKPSIAKLVQNGILLGFTHKKFGKDTFNVRI